ncbi:MAG: PTS sugar transporter subunit IIA [Endomicrobium sp.]|uniref:PTS sugar transporter subunit IIA n=1 Tax=Candidatus Endomicrobiellum cubanum TaxID=3242325 RepID=UPI002834D869|nr:PTS sugar transporter subunit IIA [Endomicrobium sp.]
MIKIAVVAHGNLAKSLVDAAELIVGSQENLYAISNGKNGSLEYLQDKIKNFLSDVIDKDGILILTDMMGGSPNNASCKMFDTFNVEIISGVNLPMLLSAIFASKNAENILQLSQKVFTESKKSIINVRKILFEKNMLSRE